MGSRPGDWSPLKLGGDPTPGDPDTLLSVADYMDAMATNAQTASTGLSQVVAKSGDGAFVGKTADWLRKQVTTEMSGFVAGVQTAFTDAGPAIRTYVVALQNAQAKADQALSSAAGANGDQATLDSLKSDAQAAGDDVKTAAGTLQTAIHNAAGYIKSPKTPKSACDIFWEIFGWITLIISIVAIFIGGPLGLIAFGLNAAMAVKTIIDFAEGKTSIAGLVLGLLAILGPTTKPLIALEDLGKLAAAVTKNVVKFVDGGISAIGKGIADFWHAVTTISITSVMHGVADLGSIIANTVKIGVLSIPKAVSALDGAIVRGFVGLKNFTLVTAPGALAALPGVIRGGLDALPGLAADVAKGFRLGTAAIGDFMVKEFGGWKWLKIFLPVAGDEIGRLGLGDAFKLGVLGRGLGIAKFSGLAGLSGGVHLAEGITKVNIVKPGDAPHSGGFNYSPSGLKLPDLTERVPATDNFSFSAGSIDLAGIGNVGVHDLAGFKGLNGSTISLPAIKGADIGSLHGASISLPDLGRLSPSIVHGVPGAVDLGAIGHLDTHITSGLGDAVQHVNLPQLGGLGSITLNDFKIGDLGGSLGKFSNGIDGLHGFGTPELRSLHMGDVNAVRVSDSGVAFNLGAPETHLGATGIDATKLGHFSMPGHLETPHLETGNLGQTGDLGHLNTANLAQTGNLSHLDTAKLGDLSNLGDVGNLGHLDTANLGQLGNLGHLDTLKTPGLGANTLHLKTPDAPRLQTDGLTLKTPTTPTKTVDGAMDLLATPAAFKPELHAVNVSIAHSALGAIDHDPSLAGLPHLAGRSDQAGTVGAHLFALKQLKDAQDALAGAGGDALAIARAQKNINVSESLVKRTSEGITIDSAHLETPIALKPADSPHVETGHEAFYADLRARLDNLRGPGSTAGHDIKAPVTPVGKTVTGVDHDLTDLTTTVDKGDHGFTASTTSVDKAGAGLEHDLAGMQGVLHDAGKVPESELAWQLMQGRLAKLRGDDYRPSADFEHDVLQARLNDLHPNLAPHDPVRTDDEVADLLASASPVPTYSPAEAVAKKLAGDRLAGLQKDLGEAKDEFVKTPEATHDEAKALEERWNQLKGDDPLRDAPTVPTDAPATIPGKSELSVRLDQLTKDAKTAGLPGDEVKALSADVRTALEEGRFGDAAGHLTDLHERIDMAALDDRLDAFRDHVDAGHARAAQAGMDKVTWLEHAVGIETAAAAGDRTAVHDLLNAYERDVATHLQLQKMNDIKAPDGLGHDDPPGGESAHGDTADDLATRLAALRDDPHDAPAPHGGDDDLSELAERLDKLRDGKPSTVDVHDELQARLDALRPGASHDKVVSDESVLDGSAFPALPRDPDELAMEAKVFQARDERALGLGMSEHELGDWKAKFGAADDEAKDAHVFAQWEDRLTQLDRQQHLDLVRGEPGSLGADEHQLWQNALGKAGTDQSKLDKLADGFKQRLAEHDQYMNAKIKAAVSAPDHLRPLNSRFDESLSSLSKDLRDQNLAANTTIGDRLNALGDRSVIDETGATGHFTEGGGLDLPDVPKKAPEDLPAPRGKADIGAGGADLKLPEVPQTGKPDITPDVSEDLKPDVEPKAADGPGEQMMPPLSKTAEMPVEPVVKLDEPPRDLIGDGKAPELPTTKPDDLWDSGEDVPPQVQTKDAGTELQPVKTVKASPLGGLYKDKPELVYEVERLGDVTTLTTKLNASINAAIHERINATWKGNVPVLAGKAIKAPEVGEALEHDPQSFFATGGRSFDVQDGLGDWHRVTITPDWSAPNVTLIDQKVDKAKFDTRLDIGMGSKNATTTGAPGSLGVSTVFPQKAGYGAGGAAEMSLPRPVETAEDSFRLTDSHNMRSGSGSHLAGTDVQFKVTISPVRGTGVTTVGTPVTDKVTFRVLEDYLNSTPRTGTTTLALTADQHGAMLVENLTPVRILRAGLNLGTGVDPTLSWNEIAEQILDMLAPTKAVEPGTAGASMTRDLLSESSFLANLMLALESPVHPPLITSSHGAHKLSLELSGEVPDLELLADVAKSSSRWQPGQSSGAKLTQSSRVGGSVSVIPVRWGFGAGYIQFRIFAGFQRTVTASIAHSGNSRIGTEFKDIKNVVVEAHFKLTLSAALREHLLSRLPFSAEGGVAPMTLDLVVLGRFPRAKAEALLKGELSTIKAPSPDKPMFVPPYALNGGRSVVYGLTGFKKLHADTVTLIRRYEGGFLPKFGDDTKLSRIGGSRAALERQQNQAELDRVLSVMGVRQAGPNLLKTGTVAVLKRSKKVGTRIVVLHVRAAYQGGFTHLGAEEANAVRNMRSDAVQQKLVAGGQWRAGGTLEGGGIARFTGKASTALSVSPAIEARGRIGVQSGAGLGGQEVRLNGGTADSQAFGTDLEIEVDVYSYNYRVGHDPSADLKVGRIFTQKLPQKPVATGASADVTRTVAGPNSKDFTVVRLSQRKDVTVLFDNASVTSAQLKHEPKYQPVADPIGVRRQAKVPLSSLRSFVDVPAKIPVKDWISIEAMPGSKFVLEMATDAVRTAQEYAGGVVSKTKLGGVRGSDGLLEGMPLWAALHGKLTESEQITALRSMLGDLWHVDKITTEIDGAETDLAVAVSLTNPEILPAYGTITNESASVGSVEVDSAKSKDGQVVFRTGISANIRKPGTETSVDGGGGIITISGEKTLYAEGTRKTDTVSGAIERNANNRKGKMRSFLVKFDMNVSVAAEVTTNPAKYAVLPQSLRTGDWLHHFKWTRRDGTIENAVYLRLSGAALEKLGILKLDGDTGAFGKPWLPSPTTQLRLLPGHSAGLGLYTFHDTPRLSGELTEGLKNSITEKALKKISESLSGTGLDDPMLNRQRLNYLMTPEGVAQHFPAMADGGVSVLHLLPGKVSQESRDIRLVAEQIGLPEFDGFVASHDDLDIKTTLSVDASVTTQRTHGSTVLGGVAATGVTNHHGENLAIGGGDSVGAAKLLTNSQTTGETTVDSTLSSGRGIKARVKIPARFSLMVFDKGKPVGSPLLSVDAAVTQDRWADDMRLPRTVMPTTPKTYRINKTGVDLGPGWRTLNGLPIPPRFSAEDLTQIAVLQHVAEGLLKKAAKRISTPGYAGAHQIHQSLTPEILLPAVPQMLTEDGFTLPAVTSAQIFGQNAVVNLKLLPEAATLSGVSSGVFREHAPLKSGGFSAATNSMTNAPRVPRIPLIGRGFADDPYQALESGGPSIAGGDALASNESGSLATGSLKNIKPESASGAVDYHSRLQITVTQPKLIGKAKPTVGSENVTVSLRMGLHDSRIALDTPSDASKLGLGESPKRVEAFNAIVANEANLAKAATAFIDAADKLDDARYKAYQLTAGTPERSAAVAKLAEPTATWEAAGEKWWQLAQKHWELLDDFRHDHLGVGGTKASTVGQIEMAQRVTDQSAKTVEHGPALPPVPPSTKTKPDLTKPDLTKPDLTKPDLTKQPPTTTITELQSPGDGRCQLYSVVASDPVRVSTSLRSAGLGSDALHAWLNEPTRVRAQLTSLAQGHQGVTAASELGQAAEGLRQLAGNHLAGLGADGIPRQALYQYRRNQVQAIAQDVGTMDRQTLEGMLLSLGMDDLTDPSLMPMTDLRGRYLALRTEELLGTGQRLGEARRQALLDVPLKPKVAGSANRDLADSALSMNDMYDYVVRHEGRIPVADLDDEVLRGMLVNHYLDENRPVDQAEFAALTQAVGNWQNHWHDALGEAFLPLLASAMDTRMRVNGLTQLGRDSAPIIDVFRRGDHYNAAIVQHAPVVKPPQAKLRVVEVESERWTPFGNAFELGADGKTIARGKGSGERVKVAYQLTASEDQWLFTVRVHLKGDPADVAVVKAKAAEGVTKYLNGPDLTISDQKIPMKVAVEFVDDPATAHAEIAVTHTGTTMDQQTWPADQSPAEFAHELVHYLGVKDTQPRPQALLQSPGAAAHQQGDLMGSHAHSHAYAITAESLREIAAVLEPHFSGSLLSGKNAVVKAAEDAWKSGKDQAPQVELDTVAEALALLASPTR